MNFLMQVATRIKKFLMQAQNFHKTAKSLPPKLKQMFYTKRSRFIKENYIFNKCVKLTKELYFDDTLVSVK